jgi:hypothetical protein
MAQLFSLAPEMHGLQPSADAKSVVRGGILYSSKHLFVCKSTAKVGLHPWHDLIDVFWCGGFDRYGVSIDHAPG